MLKINEAIIVEGIYDKKRLDTVCDAHIVPTYGFSIFTDKERLSYIRTLAEKSGIIILMDSDSAGFKIRSFLKEQITTGVIKDAFIPALAGKEKRKNRPSAEGTLGVEGISPDALLSILEAVSTRAEEPLKKITHLDFYADGLSGGPHSRALRAALCKHLSLPPRLSQKALLSAVNALMSYEEYQNFIKNQ